MNWQQYYTVHPRAVGRAQYLAQVGHTVKGEPIPEKQFRWIVSRIKYLLDLKSSDTLLDLCCGNGLITKELAATAEHVVGVDFSKLLLDIACEDHQPSNVTYRHLNVLDLSHSRLGDFRKFDKVLMYAALQHFKRSDLRALLANIMQVSTDKRVIVLGFVPDAKKKWSFYDSPRRKLAHITRRVLGTELIGTWWDTRLIEAVCNEMELSCSFHTLDPMLHASKYRFDVRID